MVRPSRWLMYLALVIPQLLPAQVSTARDGTYWRDLTPTGRVDYITGVFDGMELGKNFSIWKFSKTDSSCVSSVIESFNEYSQRYLGKTTAGQLVDGLNEFYADYKNRSIRIPGAVWLVANAIAGTPKAQLDSMVESWRRNASRSTP